MSGTTVAIRGSRAAPPGYRLHREPDTEDGSLVEAALGTCGNASCCLGDDEAALRAAYDDKYRKRIRQRKQKKLRNGLIVLSFALALLIVTVVQTRGDKGWGSRVKHRSGKGYSGHSGQGRSHPRHRHGQHLNDDHNKDDLYYDDDRKHHREGGGRGNGRRGRGRGSPDEDKNVFDRLNAYDKTRGRQRMDKSGDSGSEEYDDEAEQHRVDAIIKRRLTELEDLNARMESNTNKTIRWADMSDVPPLPGRAVDLSRAKLLYKAGNINRPKQVTGRNKKGEFRKFFQIHRPESTKMAWEKEFDAIADQDATARSDYVNYVHHNYNYPEKLSEPPELGKYPHMRTYKELMDTWPQDNIDNPPDVLQEDLIHFDWNDPDDMAAAAKFREAKLPFKVIHVPEVMAATEKWTDEYIANNFDGSWNANGPRSSGKCNEGPDNFFAFFNTPLWNIEELGIPPTRDNDWTFERWAKHSRYADRVGLHPNLPHYYWQSGVPREERHASSGKHTFVSRDLPSLSATTDNFILFHSEFQKGIQCRFGERGITAANHYDSGRNMIAMITGAKRYILSPPRACKKLGVVSSKGHASFRHSMLNYGHIALMDSHGDTMPLEEQEWLDMVGSAEAVSTVLKEGEILYVPTGWFHYITSLQKSAQCNVRSGPDMSGDAHWGGEQDIKQDCFPHD